MNFNFLVAVIIMTFSKILFVHAAINEFLKPYKNDFVDMIYKIHPLVLITKDGMNSEDVALLQQDRLDENGSLIGKLNQNQNMVLHCTGYFNCLAAKNEDQIDVAKVQIPANCKRGEIISNIVFEKNKIYSRRCLSPMLGTILKPIPEKSCANGRGVLVHSGFRVNNEGSIFQFNKHAPNPFLNLYDICFDKKTRVPIYTSHQLVKSKLLYKEMVIPDMPMNRIARDLMVLKFDKASYYPKQLKITFQFTFGERRGNELLQMFAKRKGQALLPYRLTPAGDFFYQSVKTATFMFENSTPVFSTIYDGNLKKVELMGRILAVQLNRTLLVVTGTFGYLRLIDYRNSDQVLYIDHEKEGKIKYKYRPVSKHIYKIYYEPISRGGIVFVTLNNPYVKNDDKIEPPCDNIIGDFMGVNIFAKTGPTAGITVVCSIQNLFQKQAFLRTFLNHFNFGTGILKFDIHDKNFPMDILNPSNKQSGTEKSKFLETFDSGKTGTSGTKTIF